MGMNQSQSLEPQGRRTKAFQVGDENAFIRSDDHIGNLSAAADQNPDLAVDFPGHFRKIPRQLLGDDAIRRDLPTVDLVDPFNLFRFQAAQVAVYPVDVLTTPYINNDHTKR
jgi:hypothetical protein